ncbi:GTPase with similarity to translation release factors [Komagataella phaffii CBS 7435]|uniref:GTPase with similarity to translation release factors n=1 Tax=Komagataella phaffii (strain ATCC 76273 / CBS 7435 / CECT 11047 / NRRL Y-11430 / Wegner 21-1) TaxID=981350 RepID=F2QUS6_KOMPC|nr:GQ67_04118T0 [Komagataella phaffii]AOA68208.1 GQ68_04091T0 [Komagataella phaffii GS115]CAH2449113.1 GTPase with similarity to translation release factors [Komagataella phaffii CBS 7435]CCA39154.1 GTPase with similarity to translation release factors [Komagataella phaffii CBS 7435]
MQYSDDDLNDYENEPYDDDEFIEEDLTKEELDELYTLLPLIKAKLKDHNPDITDRDFKEALWFNYMVVDDAVRELKQNFSMYKSCKRLMAETLRIVVPKEILVGGSSKLALLAKSRRAKRNNETGDTSHSSRAHSGLDSLLSKNVDEKGTFSLLDDIDLDNRPKFSLKGFKEEEKPKKSQLKEHNQQAKDTKSEDLTPQNEPSPIEKNETIKENVIPFRMIQLKFEDAHRSIIVDTPQSAISALFETTREPKRRKTSHDSKILTLINSSLTNIDIEKVKANFSKPNPVDVLANEPRSAVSKKSEVSEEPERLETVQEKLQKLTIKHTKPIKSLDINAAISKLESQNISFVVFGHVDSGKSTIIGRLLYDLKVVDSKTLHKLTKESSSIGKGSFALAWIMDQTSEERERGVTIDICQTSFNYKNKQFTIIDSPGHQDFIPQMINGVCQADIAVLIVDSSDFAKTFNHGQTKEQLRIAKSLNLNKLIVVVNKMDLCDWNMDHYNKIVESMGSYLFEDLQYRQDDCQFIPASGLNGDNVVKGKGNSLPLVDLLYHENKVKQSQPIAEQKLIMTIIDVEDQAHDNLTLKVRVNSGFVQAGETVKLLPSFDFCRINKILKSNEAQDICIAGEFVVLRMKVVKSVEEKSLIRLGDLCVSIDEEIPISSNLRMEIHLFDMDKPLLKGTPFVLFRNNVSVPARIIEIEQIMNSQKKKIPRHLSSRQRAIVSVAIESKLPIITWEEKVRRVVIRKDSSIIGAGQIIEAL